MNLKINMVSIMIACLSVVAVGSCKSHEQKNDDAFEQVKEEKKVVNDSDIVNNAMILEKDKTKPQTQKVVPNEREQYMIEMKKKIQLNENQINAIKTLPNANAALIKKVISLEKNNNDLIITMDEYSKDEKLKWELFKATMNQHVDEIGIELKAIKINNKK
jgi:pheromone shutdown protein TraB